VKDFCLEEDKAENVGLGNSMNAVQVRAQREMCSAYSKANILEFGLRITVQCREEMLLW